MILKSISAQTHQGPLLEVNEDGYDYDLASNLYMIFDGFGGAGIGDACVHKLKENIKKVYNSYREDPNSTLPYFFNPQFLLEGNVLINSVLNAHQIQFRENLKKNFSARGGASAIVASQTESLLTILSIGSCEALLIRGGKIKQIFVPDNFEMLGFEEEKSATQTLPTSAVGMYKDLYYQIKEVRIKPQDQILFLSDGVYTRVQNSEILACLLNPKLEGKLKIEELFNIANSRGNSDNQTAFILEY